MRRVPIHWLVFVGLMVYAVILTIITGDTGFQADDWWILSVPYWNSFPGSIWAYAVEFRRPLEGLPWLALFPLLGFNRTVFNLVALVLFAGTSLFLGMALTKSFPTRRDFVAATMLFWFFLPTVSSLTYVFHMDNIWTCTLLFWASVCAFQRWAEGNASPRGLILPVLLYYLGTLAYDVANLLIFLVPVFVYPCRKRVSQGMSDRLFWSRLGAGLAIAFSALLCTRFALFHGGAVRLHGIVPPFALIQSYVTELVPYITAPFQALPDDAWAIGAGIFIAIFAAAVLFASKRPEPPPAQLKSADKTDHWAILFVVLWAFGLMVLGTYQYLMAGYGATLGFHGESRIYSAASFGLAILLGYGVTRWKRKSILYAAKLAAVIALGFMATFHVDLRRSWQEAARINCNLWTSLSAQVPDVAPGTSFLFLDLQSYVSDRAIVFGGVNGLTEFIRMFYHRRDINAYYLYLPTDALRDSESRFAVASPEGVVARGVLPSKPLARDTLLVVAREGERLVLLDRISSAEKKAAIRWNGVSEIRSSRSRIRARTGPNIPFRGVCCRWCGR